MKDSRQLNSLALQMRRVWGQDAYAPIDIFSIVSSLKNMTVIKYPLSSSISGMTTKIDEDYIICINSHMSKGRQRFTLAHELYHVLFEDINGRVICGLDMSCNKSDSEKEADQFASYLLMPYDSLLQYNDNHCHWNLEGIIKAQQYFQISHQAILFRLLNDGMIDSLTYEKYKSIMVSYEAAKLGYNTELYQADDESSQYFTTGEYIRKVQMTYDLNRISLSKKEEYLLDAFREDIVYGLDKGEMLLND